MLTRININDLDAEQRRKLGVKRPRQQALLLDNIKSYAISALYPLRDLTPGERKRVLRQMVKVNDV